MNFMLNPKTGKQEPVMYKALGFVRSDGGRAEAGFKGSANDCVVRSIAIVTRIPYTLVYDKLNVIAEHERIRKRARRSNSRTGVYRWTYEKFLFELGYSWFPTMRIGSGCKVHLRYGELPQGRLIVAVSRHMTAVIDGVVYDTYNPSRDGTRCVYGYYYKKVES